MNCSAAESQQRNDDVDYVKVDGGFSIMLAAIRTDVGARGMIASGKNRAASVEAQKHLLLPDEIVERFLDVFFQGTIATRADSGQTMVPSSLLSGPEAVQPSLVWLAYKLRFETSQLRLVNRQWRTLVDRRREWLSITDRIICMHVRGVHRETTPHRISQMAIERVCALCQMDIARPIEIRLDREPLRFERKLFLDSLGSVLCCEGHWLEHRNLQVGTRQYHEAGVEELRHHAFEDNERESAQESTSGVSYDSRQSASPARSNASGDAGTDDSDVSCNCSICQRGKRKRESSDEEAELSAEQRMQALQSKEAVRLRFARQQAILRVLRERSKAGQLPEGDALINAVEQQIRIWGVLDEGQLKLLEKQALVEIKRRRV